ncbi:DUF3530 family protein [Teredinibacter sp. KSP-S5-2]|uniref:DUF3530 family protein n=1 Tax=Teredinibacter sp. KSP-S5-2 TaxID=3034506 RepID=UPI0029346E42|nr:DUF3530 family protein [Teredinibacter sp. KSP-S5-2]WNO08592.1 DUF3530 family protein [Teredinibacter sp. KSP-S5-2]
MHLALNPKSASNRRWIRFTLTVGLFASVFLPISTYASESAANAKQQQLISQELEKFTVVELSAEGEKFIALWEPDRSGTPLGAILIAHGEGQTVDWPHTLHPLRTEVVKHGWATLSISLPNPKVSSIPARETKPTNATTVDKQPPSTSGQTSQAEENTATQEPPQKTKQTPPEQAAQARIKAGMEYLQAQGQYNIVVVGNGISATRIVYFTKQLTDQAPKKQKRNIRRAKALIERPIRAVVLINARNNIPNSEQYSQPLPEILDLPDIPILDIYFDTHYLDQKEARERLESATNRHKGNYFQVKVLEPSAEIFDGENRLTRRIRGFLNKHAKGVEIK